MNFPNNQNPNMQYGRPGQQGPQNPNMNQGGNYNQAQNYGQQGPQNPNMNQGSNFSNQGPNNNQFQSVPQQYTPNNNQPQNFGQPANTNQFSAETNQKLSETNMKLTMQLASRDTVIDEKTNEIESLNNHSKQLVEQIAVTKASSAERAASLEREIQLLKAELEEARVTKLRELESQRVFLQKEVDQASKTAEDREGRVSFLGAQLAKITFEQENEATRLSSFINKTLGAVQLASQTCQNNGVNQPVLIESETNLGFSKLTLRSVIHADGTVENLNNTL